jgi:hypothetical protein
MHTFYAITNKLVHNINISDYYKNNNNINTLAINENQCGLDTIHKINFYILIMKKYSIENKFKFFYETKHNIFNTKKMSDDFLDYFNKIQKTYYAFSRLAYLYKYKKAKIMVDTDLIMNEIDEKNRFVYCLLQNNCKYLFNIHELIKIINNSIANTQFFFSLPTPVKNPYNNIPLNKSTLYNIYFFIRFRTMIHAELFHYFFTMNFNLSVFIDKYQYLLRNFAIQNALNNSSKEVMYENIDNMLYEYNLSVKYMKKQINIDDSFPKDLLISIMKPYLNLFYKSQYSLINNERLYCKKLLKKKLYHFNKFNPTFGRKIFLKRSAYLNKPTQFEYNSKHISFYADENENSHNNFMSNHTNNLFDDFNDYDSDDSDDSVNNTNNTYNAFLFDIIHDNDNEDTTDMDSTS